VLDWAIQVHGAAGVCDDFPLAFRYAQASTLRFADGPVEVHRAQIARMTALGERADHVSVIDRMSVTLMLSSWKATAHSYWPGLLFSVPRQVARIQRHGCRPRPCRDWHPARDDRRGKKARL
jgi:hypothetical protein